MAIFPLLCKFELQADEPKPIGDRKSSPPLWWHGMTWDDALPMDSNDDPERPHPQAAPWNLASAARRGRSAPEGHRTSRWATPGAGSLELRVKSALRVHSWFYGSMEFYVLYLCMSCKYIHLSICMCIYIYCICVYLFIHIQMSISIYCLCTKKKCV